MNTEHPSFLTLEVQLARDGLHCYREHFRWGHTPAYCNDARTAFRFIDNAAGGGYVIRTPRQMLAHLEKDWRPGTRADQDWYCTHMKPELEGLPE